jgi:hypothetical protein
MDDGSAIEIATVGNEGIVGIPVFLGARSMGERDFYQVQVPGWAVAMDSRIFLEATTRGPLLGLVQRYTQALFSQVTQQVACNGLHSVVERCSRWMLLTHDRVGSDKFLLTFARVGRATSTAVPISTDSAWTTAVAMVIPTRIGTAR